MSLVYEVNYSLLFSLVNVLPADYIDRFNNLCEVIAHCPVDEQHFLGFLKKLYCLKSLTLWNSNLSQRFFDTLPEFGSLTYIDLDHDDEERKDNREEDEIYLNFSFLSQFVNLNYLWITKDLSLESIRSLIPAFENLRAVLNSKAIIEKALAFGFQGGKFEVRRNSKPGYDENMREIIDERTKRYYCLSVERLYDGKKRLLNNIFSNQVVEFFENYDYLKKLKYSVNSRDPIENSGTKDSGGSSSGDEINLKNLFT